MNTELIEIATEAVKRYAESHPRPPHVNQVQAAEMLGISRPTMCKLVARGTFRLNKLGMIPISQIDDALTANRAA